MKIPQLNLRQRLALLAGGVGITILSTVAITSTNTVIMPGTSADAEYLTVTPDSMKPDQCDPIVGITAVVTGNTVINGTDANELVLAETPLDQVNAGAGNDCLVIGEGNGRLDGGDGTDICIGGPSTQFFNCETQYTA